MRRLLLATCLTAASPALAGQLAITGATASSTYAEQPGYGAEMVFDGKQSTSWVEGDSGSGLGAAIEVDLGAAKKVERIKLWAGDWSSWDYWNRANRPKELELQFDDGSTQLVKLSDDKVPQSFAIDGGGKTTQKVSIRLKAAYNGSAWFDTGISEVQLFGPGGEEQLAKTATASSVAPEDGDGTYVPANAIDGIADSMWCEGDKDGDGTGSWLEVDLGGSHTVSKLTLINGIGSSMVLWMKANQATALKLSFDDGSTVDLPIERPSYKPVPFTFPAKTTSKVRITVTGVKRGREFNDLCISEAQFSG